MLLQRGYFENLEYRDRSHISTACQHWNEYMLGYSQITNQSRILDVGCGQGDTAIWLTQKTGCEVIGIDVSDTDINVARSKLQENLSLNLTFEAADLANLPFPDQSFTHVWSQSRLFQFLDPRPVLQETQRVLQEGGIFVLDDLITPAVKISESARQNVYQPLSLKTSMNSDAYAEILNQLGLVVFESLDLSAHLKMSYETILKDGNNNKELNGFSQAMIAAIDASEIGWWFCYCKKVTDRLQWIHEEQSTEELHRKYNAWAPLYESDLSNSWVMPTHAAHFLEQLQPDKQVTILDAGAGTGKVGQALNKLGYSNLVAIDLSEGMLELAREKQVYATLHQVNLEEPLTFAENTTFDIIMAIGVFTYGHASPAGLRNLLPLLKPGGLFVLTVRASNHPMIAAFKELPWSLVRQEDYKFEDAPFHLLAYRKD